MWTSELRAALDREYERIGGSEEQWPYPSPEPTPQEFLALLRRIPDGAGLAGYLAALKDRVNGRSHA